MGGPQRVGLRSRGDSSQCGTTCVYSRWARRLVTRGLAITPVIVVAALYGDTGTTKLLILSQVILSMQLPFAVVPLVQFVASRDKMGPHAISRPAAALAFFVAAVIVMLNAKLLWDVAVG